MKTESDVSRGYLVTRPSSEEEGRLLADVLSPRRGPIPNMPGLHLVEGAIAGDKMFSEFGMDGYIGCTTGEMASRPIPQVFKAEEVRSLESLFTEYYPYVLAWQVPQIRPCYQAYAKESRVGWPGFFRPDNKLDYVTQFMPEVLAGDLSRFNEAFIIMNVRLQPEVKSKKREFQFITPDGEIYNRTIDEKARTIRTPAGPRIASRTRNVFNYPTYNLIKQALDTAIHNVYMQYPAFHHDMFNNRILPVNGWHVCLDIKHFERHTATCARVRAAMLGGVYSKCQDVSNSIPYAVHGDDFKSAFFISVNRADGWSEQFGSGDSAVAPIQKDIMLCVFISFYVKYMGYTIQDAIATIVQGGDERFRIRNYGDDNSFDGDQKLLEDFIEYAKQFLTVEIEEPPMFLGNQWFPQYGRWLLPYSSYIRKNWTPERAPFSAFRRYPNFGLVEKRKVYMKQGQPIVHEKVIPFEDKILESVGVPWYLVEARAQAERKAAATAHVDINNPYLNTEKEWMLTGEQRVRAGLATGLPPSATAPIIRKLVGKNIASKLSFS